MKLRRKLIAVALPLAVGLALLNPTPAFAAEIISTSGVLSQFSSGDVGRYKVAAERDAGTLKWRVVATVWCDNSNGASVNCGLIEGTDVSTYLQKRASSGNTATVQAKSDYLDAANTHSKRFEHSWQCEGTSLGQYIALAYNLQVKSRFGEQGTPHDRDTGFTSNYYGSC